MVEKTKSTNKKSKAVKEQPDKPKLSVNETIDVILELSRTGTPSHKIGQILKQEHNISNVKELVGKRITQILRENNTTPKLPADLDALIQKASLIRKHLASHKKDQEAKYGLQLTESRIYRLTKYYRQSKILPAEWKYEVEGRK